MQADNAASHFDTMLLTVMLKQGYSPLDPHQTLIAYPVPLRLKPNLESLLWEPA